MVGLLILLPACLPTENHGSAEMPKAFGATASNWLGCADIGGVYAWPPGQGSPLDHRPMRKDVRSGDPMLEPLGIRLGKNTDLWIAGGHGGKPLIIRARAGGRPVDLNSRPAADWSYWEANAADLKCRGSSLEFRGPTLTDEIAVRWYGGTAVEQGVRLVAMRDGALAIGQWVRVTGRTTSLSVWAESSGVTLPAGDRVYWFWSLLSRVRPDAVRVAP